MIKLILLIIVGYVIYKLFWDKTSIINTPNTEDDENDLVECMKCHTFVPKSECKWTSGGCLCKDCQ